MTDEQMAILFDAWFVGREGHGLVLDDAAIPMAHQLAEAGWLERRITDDTLGWFWTQQAEHALLSGRLVMSHENRQN